MYPSVLCVPCVFQPAPLRIPRGPGQASGGLMRTLICTLMCTLMPGALAKPLEDVLLAPFLERLQGKGKAFSLIDGAK